jgi:hypothetical protein
VTLSRWATTGYVALVFASGAVVGSLANRMYNLSTVSAKSVPSPDAWRKQYVSEMKSRLKLRDEQILRLNIMLDETRSRVREVHAKARPEIDQIKREHATKVSEMLDPDQRGEFEKLRKEREDRAERERVAQEQLEKEKPAVPQQGPAGSPDRDLI